jgi:hypothetical protein
MFKVGLDFDGVLWNFAELKHRVLYDLYGRTMKPGRETYHFMIADGVVNVEEYWELVTVLCATTRYLHHMTPLPGMSTYLPHIRTLSRDTEFRVVTLRPPAGAVVAQQWIDSHCLGVKVESANTAGSKGPHADGLHVFVDDTLEHLHEVRGIVPHRFLFSWGYNSHETVGEGIIRVYSWKELYAHLRVIAPQYSTANSSE